MEITRNSEPDRMYEDTFEIEQFIACCNHFADCINPLGIAQCKDPVFEGAQGLLLDQGNKEFFPHVTHSHTGMHNVRILCAQAGITDIDVHYVSRTYPTRHGAGPLPGEDSALSYEDETNHPTRYQGELRFAALDSKLHERCGRDCGAVDYKLVLTHADQCAPNIGANLYTEGPSRNDVSETRSKTIAV